VQVQINSNITPVNTPPASQPAPKRGRRAEGGAPEAKTDQLELSTAARALQNAERAAREAPDVREDRVNELRQAVQNGTYQVDAQVIAERILDQGL
jgi:negative regulator of flagellin synthesis FlgM